MIKKKIEKNTHTKTLSNLKTCCYISAVVRGSYCKPRGPEFEHRCVYYLPVCLCNAFLDLPTLSMMTDILSFMSYCRLTLPTLEGYQLLV